MTMTSSESHRLTRIEYMPDYIVETCKTLIESRNQDNISITQHIDFSDGRTSEITARPGKIIAILYDKRGKVLDRSIYTNRNVIADEYHMFHGSEEYVVFIRRTK